MLKKIHHVGIVVRSIASAYAFYRDTLSLPVHKEDIIQDQGVKAALLTIGASEIELLEPITPGTGVARFLENRGEGLHHVCFETDDVHRELEAAKAAWHGGDRSTPSAGLGRVDLFFAPEGRVMES